MEDCATCGDAFTCSTSSMAKFKKSVPQANGERFAPGELESAMPELLALQRDSKAKLRVERKQTNEPKTRPNRHPAVNTPWRPEVGVQDRFRQKEPATCASGNDLLVAKPWGAN